MMWGVVNYFIQNLREGIRAITKSNARVVKAMTTGVRTQSPDTL